MTIRTYKVNITDDQGTYASEYYLNNSTDSPKVNGKLVLQSNNHLFRHNRFSRFRIGGFPNHVPGSAETTPAYPFYDSPQFPVMVNEALARFTGKVRKHNASLGVTLGSMGQTRDMITSRSQKLASFWGDQVRRAEKLSPKERRKRVVEGRASDILEHQFGWVPLVQDIQAGLGALGRSAPSGWIKVAVKQSFQREERLVGLPHDWDTFDLITGDLLVSMSAKVSVTNENLWLLNRLGLLNLPGVAWDLVPWSFVVNMFTNCGQMVNSITDFVGVTLTHGNYTRSARLKRKITYLPGSQQGQGKYGGYAQGLYNQRWRQRTLGIPTPSFQWKAPQLDFGLAVIAWSLIAQRVGKFNKLMGL